VKWKPCTPELMKIFSDPRRSRILDLAADRPVTVKMLAEQLGEDPLRLYYHVKKMLKAELLEIVDTRQHGNMTENYYQAVDLQDVIYKGNVEEQSEHVELALSLVHRELDPGLRLYQKSLEKVREDKKNGATFERHPFHVSIESSNSQQTGREWQETLAGIIQVWRKDSEPLEPWLPDDGREDEEGSYKYVLLSYRIEDAEQLGLIDPLEDDEN
jgi:DNA-binding transcriptional ArsR family regulator